MGSLKSQIHNNVIHYVSVATVLISGIVVSSFLHHQQAWHWLFNAMPLLLSGAIAFVLSRYIKRQLAAYCKILKSAQERVEIDELTGLYTRFKFQDIVSQKLKGTPIGKQAFTIWVLDLDHFKTINDVFGHEVGDRLLKKVGQRLTSVLPDEATIGYLGGDGFVVLLDRSCQNIKQLQVLVKEVIHQLSQAYFVNDRVLNIGCSIGVALAPTFGKDPVTLIKNADMAVYQAKNLGRGTFHFYDEEMGKRLARNVRIETRLRQAIQENTLELHFQPKVCLETERCMGMEALLRWNDDELGQVSPSEFIPVAEQTGVILTLGDWVFKQAFQHIVEWQKNGVSVPPVAINCSAAQLKRTDFLPKLLALLEEYKIDPSLLEIEVTESILIEDAKSCAELLHQINRLGIRLAVDDFGTGYSSLSYLKDLPFDSVKIDQVFVRDMIQDKSHSALVKGIISLSHDLNLKVIAEGITDQDQLALLRVFHCDIGQGYLFSKAVGARSMLNDPMVIALNKRNALGAH